jgi:hypothetical protein
VQGSVDINPRHRALLEYLLPTDLEILIKEKSRPSSPTEGKKIIDNVLGNW